jgi:hypothetical protein
MNKVINPTKEPIGLSMNSIVVKIQAYKAESTAHIITNALLDDSIFSNVIVYVLGANLHLLFAKNTICD